MRLLVCGGRDYTNRCAVQHALSTVHARSNITLLIEGGARGADRLAREWAHMNGIPVQTYYADWKKYGGAAGPVRNGQMLREGQPHGVVAFPGGTGTADMIAQAELAGVKVWKPFKKRQE
jgi:hypothetical protein